MPVNLTLEEKKNIIVKFGKGSKDSGITEVQVALFTKNIEKLTKHLKQHKKDNQTTHGLLCCVGKRKRALNYLKSISQVRYQSIISELGIRK